MIDTARKQAVVWKPYPEYQFVEANQFGEIRTVDRIVVGKNGKKYHVKGHVLKQYPNHHGYMCVSFGMGGKQIHLFVHRIVATCFLPNPNNLPEVNHTDNNRTNNVVSNLEWCTREYNIAYREKYGTSAAEALGHPLFAVNLKTFEVSHFASQHEASRQLGVYVQNINHILKGRLSQTRGYWFTENESEITKEKIQKIKDNMLFLGGVFAVNLKTSDVSCFKSQSEAGRQLEINYRHINNVVKGQRKQTGGYWFCCVDSNAVKNVRIKFGDEAAHKVEELMKENYDLVQ